MRQKSRSDEFNWANYSDIYSKQILELMQKHDLFVTSIDHNDDGLVFHDNLHDNWKDLYNLIYQLNPKSVYEVGCGSGQHLDNIHTILPFCELHGCDISLNQLNFGRHELYISQFIFANVTVDNFDLLDISDMLGKYSVVYSHAVLMHLNPVRALNILRKMLSIANKYVIFIETTHKNNFGKFMKQIGKEYSVTKPTKYNTNIQLIKI